MKHFLPAHRKNILNTLHGKINMICIAMIHGANCVINYMTQMNQSKFIQICLNGFIMIRIMFHYALMVQNIHIFIQCSINFQFRKQSFMHTYHEELMA